MGNIENMGAGSFMFGLSLFFLITNGLCCFIIYRRKSLFKLNTYKIIICIIIVDSVQLLVLSFCGVHTAAEINVDEYLAKVLGGIANSFWIIDSVMGVILGVNRCTAVLRVGENLFVGYRLLGFIGCAFSYGFCFLIAYLYPGILISYDYKNYYIGYSNDSMSQIVSNLEIVSNSITNFIMFLCYFCIFINLKLARKSLGRPGLNMIEKGALSQSFAICFMICVTFISWFVLPTSFDGKWPRFFCTVLWISCLGENHRLINQKAFIYILYLKLTYFGSHYNRMQ